MVEDSNLKAERVVIVSSKKGILRIAGALLNLTGRENSLDFVQ